MNPKGKKLLSLFLVFSLVMLSINLYAKVRRGAKLIITKKDGLLIEGELITVKQDSLLLRDTEGKDVSVDIADIRVIRIVKKSKALLGGVLGLLIGGGGAFSYFNVIKGYHDTWAINLLSLGAAGIGALIGLAIGASAGADKTFQIEGRPDSEIQKTMDKLRKKARIRDYK